MSIIPDIQDNIENASSHLNDTYNNADEACAFASYTRDAVENAQAAVSDAADALQRLEEGDVGDTIARALDTFFSDFSALSEDAVRVRSLLP